MHITVNCQLSTLQSHLIAEEMRHSLFHILPALVEVVIRVDLCECDETVDYHPTRHHVFLPAAD
jgi:divalent metal cation (Fe/Co/Zn/Cd) transporter